MSSAVWASLIQRSHVSPSCPSIMMPTFMGILLGLTPYRIRGQMTDMSRASAPRLLLLVPTTTYRTEDFVEAARRLDVDLVVAAEQPNTMAAALPDHLLTLPFDDPALAASLMREFARTRPIAAVVPVDDATTVVGAAIGQALGLRANAPAAVSATRDKQAMRERLARAGVPQPPFTVASLADDPRAVAARVRYPCVLKPLVLSASRGVIRADSE